MVLNWKRILVMCLCFVMAGTGVCADSLILSYDPESRSVDISLEMDDAAGFKPVTLVIAEEGSADYAYIREYSADADGKLELTAGLSEGKASGKYLASLKAGDSEVEGWFWHMNLVQAAPSVDKVNDAKTAAALTEVLRSESDNLGIDIDYFNEKASDISTFFLNIKGSRTLTPLEYVAAYYTACVFAYSKGETVYKNIDLLLKSNSKTMGIDYEMLAAASADVKNEVYSRFSKSSYTYWDVEKQYDEWVNLAVINTSTTWNTYYKLISDTYAAELQLDLTKYNNSSYKQEIIKDLMKQSFDNYQSLRNAFTVSVNKNRESDNNRGTGPGTGSNTSKEMEFAGQPTQPGGVTPPAETEKFSDVEVNHWAYTPINELCKKNVLAGYTDGMFRPGNDVTRAEFAKMLASAFYPGQSGSGSAFNDVNAEDWYYQYVSLLFDKGVVGGDENGSFNPSNPISRQDMAVMVLRICGGSLNAIREYAEFSDEGEIAAYATESVSVLYSAGILNGMPGGSFMPKGRLSRAEAAKVIYELLNTGGVV